MRLHGIPARRSPPSDVFYTFFLPPPTAAHLPPRRPGPFLFVPSLNRKKDEVLVYYGSSSAPLPPEKVIQQRAKMMLASLRATGRISSRLNALILLNLFIAVSLRVATWPLSLYARWFSEKDVAPRRSVPGTPLFNYVREVLCAEFMYICTRLAIVCVSLYAQGGGYV